MLLGQLYKTLRRSLSESDSRYVIAQRLKCSHADIISHPEQEIDATECLNDLKRAEAGEPLSRIYGAREFWGMEFQLSSETLDPRPDTETLVEAVLARYRDDEELNILDLGTGSGCILLSLLSELRNAQGIGVDISADAIKTAERNAKNLGIDGRSQFVQSSWAAEIDEKFDVIVSNPPYIASEVIPNLDENVQKFDPILALDGGKDGLQAYKIIFSDLSRILKRGGRAFFEIGFDQEESVTRLSKESRFLVEGVHRDSAGHPRVVEIFFPI